MPARARSDSTSSAADDPTAPNSNGRTERHPLLDARREPLALATPWVPTQAMPRDFSISVARAGAVDQRIAAAGERPRTQSLRGFDETFTDIVDFIVRVTHHIWEEKSLGYLYEHYRHNTSVIDDSGLTYGRERVIENTAQFLSAFPDLRLFAEDVIWCGSDRTGFLCSHRVMLVGHNTGYSQYGPPTGRRIALRCIADTRSIDNQIFDEYVIYNTGSLLRQLGRDLPTEARRVAESRAPDPEHGAHGDVERLLGQGHPVPPAAPAEGEDIGAVLRRAQHEIWNWRRLDRIDAYYAQGVRIHGPTDREFVGVGDYKGYVLSLLAMFPDAAYSIDSMQWMGNDDEGFHVSTRWRLTGTHRGFGYLGAPTGRRMSMWGITHQGVRDGRIVEEFTLSNEFDVMVQLLAPDGSR